MEVFENKTVNFAHMKRFSVRKYIFIILTFWWAIPAVVLLRLVRPIRVIKFQAIRSDRIGHLVSDSAEVIAREKLKLVGDYKVLRYFYGKPANTHWVKMWYRSRPKHEKYLAWVVSVIGRWNSTLIGGKFHSLPSSLTDSRDIFGLFSKTDSSLSFTESEDSWMKSWLTTKGWQEGEPFVVLHVRDSKYLKHQLPGVDCSYHDYRNSKIMSYLKAVDWLTARGVRVIRIGRFPEEALPVNSSKVVDHASSSNQNDLIDIWLCANATFIISTASGLDYLGGIYRVPILFLNAIPLANIASYFHMTWVPKKLIYKESKVDFQLLDYLKHSYVTSEEYSKNGIEVIDLDEDEILNEVIDFWKNLDGNIAENISHKTQDFFWQRLKEVPNYSKLHSFIHPRAQVSNRFLNKFN